MSNKHYKTYRINDYSEDTWWPKSLIDYEDDYCSKTIDPYTYTVNNTQPYSPPPQQPAQKTYNASNSTLSGYLSGATSTSVVFNGITDAMTTGLSKKEVNSISTEEFDTLENFKSPADVASEGIFIPGQLYRFNSDQEMTYQYVVLMEDVEKDGTTIVLDARDKDSFDGKVFLCLETRWVDGPVTTIVRKGVTKFIDRLWQTVFLSGSKTYTFFWFENPREAEHYGNVQACSKFWQAHLGVLLKGLAGNIGNAVGLSVASNILSSPGTATTQTTTLGNPLTGMTTTSISTQWGWSTHQLPTTATVTTVPYNGISNNPMTIPSEESFFAMPSREMFIRIT